LHQEQPQLECPPQVLQVHDLIVHPHRDLNQAQVYLIPQKPLVPLHHPTQVAEFCQASYLSKWQILTLTAQAN